MILIDFHALIIAHVAIMAKDDLNFEIDEKELRKRILWTLKKYRRQFRSYGEILIACDGNDYWRRAIFPYYKINRKKAKEESNIDWDAVHQYIDKIKEELKEHTPFPVVQVDVCEADDIVGVLAETLTEPVLVLSRDKDFKQLHYISDLKQYDPIGEKFIEVSNPKKILFDHVCKGDAVDGIPNYLMEDNAIAVKTRQKPIYQKKLDALYESGEDPGNYFKRNRKLIDFRLIPKKVKELILDEYEAQINKPKPNLRKYFINFGASEFITEMADFI